MKTYPTLHNVKLAPGAWFWALSWYQPMSPSKQGISGPLSCTPLSESSVQIEGFCGPCRRERDCEWVGCKSRSSLWCAMGMGLPQQELDDMESAGREPTAVLEVDDGLRLRLGVDLLVELSVLRLRIAAAFAAKVGSGILCLAGWGAMLRAAEHRQALQPPKSEHARPSREFEAADSAFLIPCRGCQLLCSHANAGRAAIRGTAAGCRGGSAGRRAGVRVRESDAGWRGRCCARPCAAHAAAVGSWQVCHANQPMQSKQMRFDAA